MALKLFNTLSRSLQEFVPLDATGQKLGLYCCGPTVYDFAHIGNWRTFIFGDLVRRYLEFKGKFEAAFFDDLKTLNCRMPHQTPRATEHIANIIALIDKLIGRGLAYKAADGSVYFSIEKYRARGLQYGQLVNLNFDEMRVGERVSSDEYAKEAVADFALWKARASEDGDG